MYRLIVFTLMLQVTTLSLWRNGILGEIIKWPALIEHYCEHNEQGESGIFEFLYDHYVGHESDSTDHANFPFQLAGGIPIHCDFTVSDYHHYPTSSWVWLANHYVSRKERLHESDVSNGIWQPPTV
jgi:hypothetical protein